MHFSLVRISPPAIPTTHGFDDAILPFFLRLETLVTGWRYCVIASIPQQEHCFRLVSCSASVVSAGFGC